MEKVNKLQKFLVAVCCATCACVLLSAVAYADDVATQQGSADLSTTQSAKAAVSNSSAYQGRGLTDTTNPEGDIFIICVEGDRLVAVLDDGSLAHDMWVDSVEGDRYYFGSDGFAVKYLNEIDGYNYYFNGRDYTQYTGVITWKSTGKKSYFDPYNDGMMSTDRWISVKGKKYYLDDNGYSVKYRQTIDGDMYYFNGNGTQYTGILTWKNDGRISFFDAKQKGKASTERWISWKGKKYYLDENGYSVRYLQNINGNKYYFNKSCQMQTGVVVWKNTGKLSYFDPRQGGKASTNRWISYKGTKYYLDGNGYSTKRVR